jgi:CheY-like chemotaxis protein
MSSLDHLEDCSVEMAYSGREALEQCRQQKYDVIVVDYQMPDLTGAELAVELQSLSPATKIILMTALSMAVVSRKVIPPNIVVHLEKPVPLAEFRQVVQQVLQTVT